MAGPRPDDNYNPVPEVAPNTVMPNDTASVRASAENMGGLIGQGLQNLGQGLQQGAEEVFKAKMYQQGLANEHAATMAELNLATQGGDIYNEYKTKQGLDAANSREAYISKYMQLNDQIRSGLPNAASQRAYDAMATRRLSFTVQDMNGYAATQQRQAYKSGNAAAAQQHIDAGGTMEIASNPVRLADEKGSLIFRVNQTFTDPGFGDFSTVPAKTDTSTGKLVFEDSKDGKYAQAEYNQYLDKRMDEFYTNAVKILATNPDPSNPGNSTKAVNFLLANQKNMPATTFNKLSGMLNSSFINEQVHVGGQNILDEYTNKYQETGSTGSGGGNEHGPSSPNNLGNVTIHGGAFAQPKTPLDGVILNANNLKDHRYDGQTLEDMSHIWTSTDQKAWLANVSKGSGLDPKTVIDANNPVQVKQLLRGIATAEKSPEDRKLFSDQVISQGVEAAFKGQKPDLLPTSTGVTPTLTGGFRTSQADYLGSNLPEMEARARQDMKDRGYDVTVQDQAAAHVRALVGEKIGDQSRQAKGLYDNVLRAVLNPTSPITNLNDVTQSSNQQLRDDFYNLQGLDPWKASAIEKIINNQATNHSKTYGTDYYSHLQDILSGKVTKMEDLQDYFGTGDKSPISPLGVRALSKTLEEMNTPQGQGFAHAESAFLDTARNVITGASVVPGTNPAVLGGKFDKYLLTTIPQIEAKKADMTKRGEDPSQMFNPESKDYIGKNIVAPSLSEITKAQTSSIFFNPGAKNQPPVPSTSPATGASASTATGSYKTVDDVGLAYSQGKINKDQARDIVTKQFGGFAPKVPNSF